MSGTKPKLVIFEGADKVGKTTLFRLFRAATHYIPLAIDRFTGSNFVYDKHYGRETNIDDYLDAELEIQKIFDCYLIVLVADEDTILRRIQQYETGNAAAVALGNFRKINRMFKDYYLRDSFYVKAHLIDTSKCTEAEALNEILRFTGEVNRNESDTSSDK